MHAYPLEVPIDRREGRLMCPPQAVMARRPEEQLVSQLRDRDACALEEIDRRHRQALRAHARRLLSGTGVDPDDVVQDTLLRVWSNPPAERTTLTAWLHVVLRNRGIDVLRSASLRRTGAFDREPGHASDPSHAAERREELERLTRAILDLPERQARALALSAVGGHPQEEIAREMGTSVGGVKQLVHSARSTLQDRAIAGE